MDLFVVAARRKFRFQTCRGDVTVEDLWDMPLTSKNGDGFDLDTLAISLDEAVDTKSFVKRRSDTENPNALKLEVVKFVIDSKIAEADAAEQDAAKRDRKEKLMAALANKEDAKLTGMSEDELRAELAKL